MYVRIVKCKSPLSHFIEVRTLMAGLEAEGVPQGMISFKRLRERLPKKRSSTNTSPYYRHRYHCIGDSYLRDYLKTAKIFQIGCMERFADDVERIMYDPVKQVSSDVLFKVGSFGTNQRGGGNRVWERFQRELQQSKSRCTLTEAENRELVRVRAKLQGKQRSREVVLKY